MDQQTKYSLHAAGSVDGAGAVVSPPVLGGGVGGIRNWTVARTGAGLYTITLGSEIGLTERVVILSPRDVLDSHVVQLAAGSTSALVQVATADKATVGARDTAFDFAIWRVEG